MQNTNDTKTRCRRCGDCCRSGGPALHHKDLALIESGDIPLSSIVTLRPGERVYDQVAQSIMPLESEILKIKGRDGSWTCTFFSPEGGACGIYENRPQECEVLFCRDTQPLADIYDKDRLSRTDVLPEGHPLFDLINEHNAKCAPLLMEELGKKARTGDAESGQSLKEMVTFDMEIRRLLKEKSGMTEDLSDFLFGRPLRTLLKSMNINVYEVGDTIRFSFAQGE